MEESAPLVVGIGASAGGIPALESFFRNLPDDSGMIFIIVTHLSPDRRSLLHEIIARYTSDPVSIAEDGTEVLPNNVYVMPEGMILTLSDGRLRLTPDDPVHRERKPIDVLFASLADDQGENAVGIVMSGGDGDGTLGVKAIKERGGITMAQTDGASGPVNHEMPDSAMASGLIDFAEPAEKMPERLAQLRANIDVLVDLADGEQDRERRDETQQAQADVARLLRNHTGHDFSGYKSKTFMRRVARRMKVLQVTSFEDYVQQLEEDPSEVMSLFRDLLINVTNFFRDADAFAALETDVIPQLFTGRGADDTIRLWVPGCATGEEVYSLGILLREHMDGLETVPKVQIFATDIDDAALSSARAGRYPDPLLASVAPERLKRFFRRDGASLVVSKEVREMCIFSPHSVISDPPFSRMDLVSCRNLLIYLGGELQDRVIPTFHYALKPGGFLFLGTSEGVSRHSDLFAPIDKQQRIFQSRDLGRTRRLPITLDPLHAQTRRDVAERTGDATGIKLRQRVETQVLERHAPSHVVITHEGETLYFSAGTGRYLEMPRGAPNRQIFDLARREFRADLRAVLREAMETGQAAGRNVMMLDGPDQAGSMIGLTVEPIEGVKGTEALFLVLFTELGNWAKPTEEASVPHVSREAEAALERELRDLRERNQSMGEEYETALEEMKSSNEELVSVNEEAQSTNEELEASREEMQSLNEELSTINGELAKSVEHLDRTNTDLKNLYAATQIATVFLDRALVIRNFTPVAAQFFNIRSSDVGRPLTELASSVQYPDLAAEVQEVFRSGKPVERRLTPDDDGLHFLVRLMPYRNEDEGIDGVVVTLVDISSLARAAKQQKVLIAELNHRVKNMLAVVISISNTTRRSSSGMDDFFERFKGRLQGMARAYSLLSDAEWTKVAILDLIRTEAAAFGADRIATDGPEVALSPEQALSLGLVFHELATNAAKYGALSNDEGRVEVNWQVENEKFRLKWSEAGGPPVTAPKRKGFGTTLVEGQVGSHLDGETRLSFAPEGFVLEMSFGLDP